MRFHPNGPSIPDTLLERCDAGRVVFLCGAGVSFPSGMPTFLGLAQYVIEFFDPPADSDVMVAFRPWLDGQSAANVPLDQIFNLLHSEYGKEEVNALVTERLGVPLEDRDFGREHSLIRRISSSPNGVPQIVTTNFDRLFELGEQCEGSKRLDLHVPPVFPDLNFGSAVEGITYLHGRLVDSPSQSHSYVLSSADFGRAYLSEGWATNFIRHLLERYTVVLVGYQAEDPPVKYLLQGLNHDGKYDRSKLYAFDRGLPEEIESKWRDRGVTAIAYSEHADLWRSIESWADRADDSRGWRASIIAKCQQDPKIMAPYERGQVAHVLRTVQGARLFAEAEPAPHPEWVCVLDANIRSAKKVRGYGDEGEFDPSAAYGLDDDLTEISEDSRKKVISNDNLFIWREGDESPRDFHRLGNAFPSMPKRLFHLATWISKSIDSPVLAWWAIRQNGLHPQLIEQLEWQVEHSKALGERARHIWNLIFEHHRDPRNHRWNGEWFDFKSRLKMDGWTPGVLREFRKIIKPRLAITQPYRLKQVRPPSTAWNDVRLSDLGHFDVALLDRYDEGLVIPDELLPQVVGVLEEQLKIASGLLEDIETVYFDTPTCYPDREVDGTLHANEAAKVVAWFIQLFDQMALKWPRLARARATTWPSDEKFFFRKLRLYTFNKAAIFEADYVASEVSSLAQDVFWDSNVVRELLFLLVDRWQEFSQASRDCLADRILAGPNKPSHWSDEEFPRLRDEFAVRYARYLELQGCEFTTDRSERIASLISSISEWSDGWAISIVKERGSHGGWVRTDEKPDALMSIPVNLVVQRAKEDLKRDFDSLTERRPFTGLVKENPRKALSALTIAGRNGDYPSEFWSPMITDLPPDIKPRLKRAFLNRVARLPHSFIAELGHTFGRWIEENLVDLLKFDSNLGWAVYDHVIDGILSAGPSATKSGIGEVLQGGKVIERSRRTFSHAINGPIGMCVDALFHAVPGAEQKAGSLIPNYIKTRLERLFLASGEGSDHAVSITCRQLNWIMFVDPAWTAERLIPMLAFDHPASEPAWNGFLHSGDVPTLLLATTVKSHLIHIFQWIEGCSWDRDLSKVAAQWLGWMRIFRPNEEGGLSRVEMRSALRAMSDETRNGFIYWLGQVGGGNANGWTQYVIPLVNEDWPRERQFRTATSVKAWIALLDDTGDCFPSVYEAVKKFLVPVEADDHPFYRFTREIDNEKSITEQFPDATLDFMDRVTPLTLTRPPYELPKILAVISDTRPDLKSDPRYLRLIDLVERS